MAARNPKAVHTRRTKRKSKPEGLLVVYPFSSLLACVVERPRKCIIKFTVEVAVLSTKWSIKLTNSEPSHHKTLPSYKSDNTVSDIFSFLPINVK